MFRSHQTLDNLGVLTKGWGTWRGMRMWVLIDRERGGVSRAQVKDIRSAGCGGVDDIRGCARQNRLIDLRSSGFFRSTKRLASWTFWHRFVSGSRTIENRLHANKQE